MDRGNRIENRGKALVLHRTKAATIAPTERLERSENFQHTLAAGSGQLTCESPASNISVVLYNR